MRNNSLSYLLLNNNLNKARINIKKSKKEVHIKIQKDSLEDHLRMLDLLEETEDKGITIYSEKYNYMIKKTSYSLEKLRGMIHRLALYAKGKEEIMNGKPSGKYKNKKTNINTKISNYQIPVEIIENIG